MQQSYNLDHFFSDFDATINNNRPRFSFQELFSINFVKYDAKRIADLQLSIQQLDDKMISDLIEKNTTIKKISWPAFENFIQCYLICIRDLDPWSIINSIDLMISVFESQSFLFNPKNNIHERITKQMIPYFEESMSLMIPLSSFIDIESMHIHNRINDFPRLTYISTILLKALNNMRSKPDLNNSDNINIIGLLLDTSTNLCNVYYKIGSPMLCANVFSNINILNLNKRFISKSRLIKLRFVMGKYYLHQSEFLQSFIHLNACYKTLQLDLCPISNITRILKYLIPVGLIMGKVADINKLRTLTRNRALNENDYDKLNTILNIYEPLIESYKSGNFFGVYRSISNNEKYWKTIGLWIAMLQRLRILIFRNLLFQIWKFSNSNLNYEFIRTGLKESLKGIEQLNVVYQIKNDINEPIDDIFIDNLLAALTSSGYLKMKITADRNTILSKKDTFPDIFTVISGRFTANPREAWLDN